MSKPRLIPPDVAASIAVLCNHVADDPDLSVVIATIERDGQGKVRVCVGAHNTTTGDFADLVAWLMEKMIEAYTNTPGDYSHEIEQVRRAYAVLFDKRTMLN